MKNVDSTKLEKAMSNAVASSRMEGYAMPLNHIKLAEALVLGKLTKEDCLKQLLAERV